MNINVNQDACIGCGACAAIADDLFELNDEGLSEAKVDTVPEDQTDKATEAMESCPTGAIELE